MRNAGVMATVAFFAIVLCFAPVVHPQAQNSYEGLIAELEARIAVLEELTQFQIVVQGEINGLAGPHMIFEGVNLHIESGSGSTDDGGSPSGLGNLVVGYNEVPVGGLVAGDRDGSHNIVLGPEHKYLSTGGFVAGFRNTISGLFASVSGGDDNTASGARSSVSGGECNTASATRSSVSGGINNIASGNFSSVSGGLGNTASSSFASVSGGLLNTASGDYSSVSGGSSSTASGFRSSVSGGFNNTASAFASSVSGGTGNTACGTRSSVSGGDDNTASGARSSVSGGACRTAPSLRSWRAGGLFEAN